MAEPFRILTLIRLATLLVWLPALTGCDSGSANESNNVVLNWPESNPPVLSRRLVDRLSLGMGQDDVMTMLLDASPQTPDIKSTVEMAQSTSRLNNHAFNLTLNQGKRTLILNFKDNRLYEAKHAGMEDLEAANQLPVPP